MDGYIDTQPTIEISFYKTSDKKINSSFPEIHTLVSSSHEDYKTTINVDKFVLLSGGVRPTTKLGSISFTLSV